MVKAKEGQGVHSLPPTIPFFDSPNWRVKEGITHFLSLHLLKLLRNQIKEWHVLLHSLPCLPITTQPGP